MKVGPFVGDKATEKIHPSNIGLQCNYSSIGRWNSRCGEAHACNSGIDSLKKYVTQDRIRLDELELFSERRDELSFERKMAGVRAGHKMRMRFNFATCWSKGTLLFVATVKNTSSGKSLMYPPNIET